MYATQLAVHPPVRRDDGEQTYAAPAEALTCMSVSTIDHVPRSARAARSGCAAVLGSHDLTRTFDDFE